MQKVFTSPVLTILIGKIYRGCEIMINWQQKILISAREDFLFYSYLNNNTFFTLMDKNGNIIKSEEIPTVDCFVKAMKKAGYKLVKEIV
jgi:hypothetical protein